MKFKKIIAAALAAVVTAAALMLPASAESIADTAKSKKAAIHSALSSITPTITIIR